MIGEERGDAMLLVAEVARCARVEEEAVMLQEELERVTLRWKEVQSLLEDVREERVREEGERVRGEEEAKVGLGRVVDLERERG